VLQAVLALTVLAQSPTIDGAGTPGISKKTAYLAAKTSEPTAHRAARHARPPIWGHNLRTHEIMPLSELQGLTDDDYDRFFRCWFTGEHGDIPRELVGTVIAAAEHFEVGEVRVISGFRHPKYNLSLRKKGREVAKKSQHTKGNAIDFFLPGVPTRKLYDYLVASHPGGVWFYPVSEFVHVDLGRKRTWGGT
jgi:uncharacterized protein YcbK (DUF882 family)